MSYQEMLQKLVRIGVLNQEQIANRPDDMVTHDGKLELKDPIRKIVKRADEELVGIAATEASMPLEAQQTKPTTKSA